MNSYNGYYGELRAAAQRWLNAQWASGAMKRPALCCACGQDKGIFDAHAEDYSLPFAAGKTDEFHLCFPCHMAVHCRFRQPPYWDTYRAEIRRGRRTLPFMRRDFGGFIARYFSPTQLFTDELWFEGDGRRPARLVLDEIDQWLLVHTGKGWR